MGKLNKNEENRFKINQTSNLTLVDAPQWMLCCPVRQPPAEALEIPQLPLYSLSEVTQKPDTSSGLVNFYKTTFSRASGITSGWQGGVERMRGHGKRPAALKYFPMAALLSCVRNADVTPDVRTSHSAGQMFPPLWTVNTLIYDRALYLFSVYFYYLQYVMEFYVYIQAGM